MLSEPYLLEAVELGLTSTTLPLAQAVFRAQERRHRQTGALTAVSEDNLDRPPYFVYFSVLNGRRPWAASSPPATAFRSGPSSMDELSAFSSQPSAVGGVAAF